MQEMSRFGRACLGFGCKIYLRTETKCPRTLEFLQRRSSSTHYGLKISDSVEKAWKIKDAVPSTYSLVYRAGMENYVKFGYSLSVICIGLAFYNAYLFFYQDVPFAHDEFIQTSNIIYCETSAGVAFMIFASGMVPLLLNRLCARYVLRMYYDKRSEMYRAITPKLIPSLVKSHDFKAGTAVMSSKINQNYSITYKCNGRKLIIFENRFTVPFYFTNMFASEWKS